MGTTTKRRTCTPYSWPGEPPCRACVARLQVHGLTQSLLRVGTSHSGPSFKRGYKFGEMQNVDIYALCCHLLGLDPAPNNGTLARVTPLLRDP